MQQKIGLLLVNLGTPKSPSNHDVAAFLKEFLTDGRVIDVPWWKRQLLVRGMIVPFRHRASAATYRKVWSEEGSPLMAYSRKLAAALQTQLGQRCQVVLAMRYGEPSIQQALQQLQAQGVHKLIVLPLFPQYTSATTGSVHQEVMRVISQWNIIPELAFINSFATHPAMITAFAEIGQRYQMQQYDHILFSFHGLPAKQIKKADIQQHCQLNEHCCQKLQACNAFCYRAQCMATGRLIAQKLELTPNQYTICFQSRLGSGRWLEPYTSATTVELAKKGHKKVLVFSPSFVVDCLETLYEIQHELSAEFCEHGGQELTLVEGLNLNPCWLAAMEQIVQPYLQLNTICT